MHRLLQDFGKSWPLQAMTSTSVEAAEGGPRSCENTLARDLPRHGSSIQIQESNASGRDLSMHRVVTAGLLECATSPRGASPAADSEPLTAQGGSRRRSDAAAASGAAGSDLKRHQSPRWGGALPAVGRADSRAEL